MISQFLSSLLFIFVLGIACHIANQVEQFYSAHLEADLIIEWKQAAIPPNNFYLCVLTN